MRISYEGYQQFNERQIHYNEYHQELTEIWFRYDKLYKPIERIPYLIKGAFNIGLHEIDGFIFRKHTKHRMICEFERKDDTTTTLHITYKRNQLYYILHLSDGKFQAIGATLLISEDELSSKIVKIFDEEDEKINGNIMDIIHTINRECVFTQ